MGIFPTFFFKQYRPGKVLLRYSRLNKRLSRLYKKRSSKSSKIVIFPTHGYGAKMANLCNFSFLGNMELWNRENVFYDVLDQTNAFLGSKNKKFNKSKNWPFSKGVNPWIWSRNGHFSNFLFFRQYRQGKCLLRYSRSKKTPF